MKKEKIEKKFQELTKQENQLIFQLGVITYNFLEAGNNLKNQITPIEMKRKKIATKLPKQSDK